MFYLNQQFILYFSFLHENNVLVLVRLNKKNILKVFAMYSNTLFPHKIVVFIVRHKEYVSFVIDRYVLKAHLCTLFISSYCLLRYFVSHCIFLIVDNLQLVVNRITCVVSIIHIPLLSDLQFPYLSCCNNFKSNKFF